jgi:hypothetical protein
MTENIPGNESTPEINMSGNLYRLQLASNSWRLKRFKEILMGYGFKDVRFATKEISEELKFENLTLLILPTIGGLEIDFQNGNFIRDGYKVAVRDAYKQFDTDGFSRFSYNNLILADYYKNRNLVICYTNLFMTPYSVNYFKMISDYIFSNLSLNKTILPVVTISEIDKLKLAASKFTLNIRESVYNLDRDINDSRNYIERCGTDILKYEQKIQMTLAQQESLKKMLVNSSEEFAKRVDELKDVKFLEKYSIEKDHILLDYGKIEIEVSNKKYYIGKFLVLIYPTTVRFKNYDFAGETGSIHPHVYSDGHACFGTYQEDISKLLATLDFKRLAFLLKQFLVTWNPKSPARNIYDWDSIEIRRKSKEASKTNKIETNHVDNRESIVRNPVRTSNKSPVRRVTLSALQREEFLRRRAEMARGISK